jgi:hypothetical protein
MAWHLASPIRRALFRKLFDSPLAGGGHDVADALGAGSLLGGGVALVPFPLLWVKTLTPVRAAAAF